MIPRILLFTLLLGAHSLRAQISSPWAGSAAITFSGTSTLHDWAGQVAAQPFTTLVASDATGVPTQISAKVTVAAKTMDTAEPKRDENMRKAMKVTEHPWIVAQVNAAVGEVSQDGKTPATLPMKLKLLGKEQSVQGRISQWKLVGKKATFDLDFDVSLKASGIEVPSVLLFIRVGDAVKVHATVTLTQP